MIAATVRIVGTARIGGATSAGRAPSGCNRKAAVMMGRNARDAAISKVIGAISGTKHGISHGISHGINLVTRSSAISSAHRDPMTASATWTAASRNRACSRLALVRLSRGPMPVNSRTANAGVGAGIAVIVVIGVSGVSGVSAASATRVRHGMTECQPPAFRSPGPS